MKLVRRVILDSRGRDTNMASSVSTPATPPSLCESLDQEEKDGAEGKTQTEDDKATKANSPSPMTRTNRLRKKGLGARKRDSSESYVENPTSSTDPSVRPPHESHKGKGKQGWGRVMMPFAPFLRDSTGYGDLGAFR